MSVRVAFGSIHLFYEMRRKSYHLISMPHLKGMGEKIVDSISSAEKNVMQCCQIGKWSEKFNFQG